MRKLVANVKVGEVWYGPCNPDAPMTDDVAAQITNEAAWGEDEDQPDKLVSGESVFSDNRIGDPAEGPGIPMGSDPPSDGLDDMERDDLVALAKAREIEVPKRASKADIVSLLRQQD